MAPPPSMPDGWYDGKDRDQFFTSKWNRGCYVRFTGSFQNAQGGTMLDLYGGGGHTPAVAGFSDGGPSNKNQTWKLVEVITGAYAIVNVGNNHHIVAQGKNQPVLCDDRSIDDRKGWWRLSGQTGNNKNKFETLRFKNQEFDEDGYLDLAAGHSGNGTPVYCYKGNSGNNQKWKLISRSG